jgi:hypothetical protein
MPPPENNGLENPPPAGKPYSVRRVNNVPLVIGFCLVAAFVAIVFLVVLPSNDSARKETKTKIVSAEGEAAAINAGAPSGFVPAHPAALCRRARLPHRRPLFLPLSRLPIGFQVSCNPLRTTASPP